jgi:hypothetical protein
MCLIDIQASAGPRIRESGGDPPETLLFATELFGESGACAE